MNLTHTAIASVNAALNAILDTPIGSGGFMDWYTDASVTGTVSVTNGSASITFSTAQTIAAGTIIQFASQAGQLYALASAVSSSTSGTLTAVYLGTTNASTTSSLRPGTPDVSPLGGNTKLAHLPLSATPFGAASAGTKTANSITSASALATGTATWFRYTNSGGTGVLDGSIGTSGCDLNLNSVAISSGATCAVTAATVSMAQ